MDEMKGKEMDGDWVFLFFKKINSSNNIAAFFFKKKEIVFC